MTASETNEAVTDHQPSARRVWILVALWPAGILAGLVVMYILATIMGVTVEPSDGQHASLADRVVILGITGFVWLVAPVMAVIRSIPVATGGRSSGKAALAVSALLVFVTIAMTIDSIVDPGNML